MLPTSLDLQSDVCLATVTDSQLICVSREISVIDGWLNVPLTQTGVFTVIFNPDMQLKDSSPDPDPEPTPDPDPEPLPDEDPVDPVPDPIPEPEPEASDECSSVWCKNKWLIIGVSLGTLYYLILIIVLIICAKKRGQKPSNYQPLDPEAPNDDSAEPKEDKENARVESPNHSSVNQIDNDSDDSD